eukprot:scaffold3437_cov113-Cylindrotheca_fusiformis.AAC.13
MTEHNEQDQSPQCDVHSNDGTIQLENKSSVGMSVIPDAESATFQDSPQQTGSAASQKTLKTKEPSGHKRIVSDLSVTSMGSKSSRIQKPKSSIGKVYRYSQSSGQPVIRTVSGATGTAEGAVGDDEEATWNDVCRACCIHTQSEWLKIGGFLLMLLFLLYTFLVALDLLGTSFKVVGGCTAGSMLSSETNPMAAVMIGIIATTLLQSSSTTTAIIVSLVSGGLDVKQGI